jgi:ParB/RepB/Spo0J family partition protein
MLDLIRVRPNRMRKLRPDRVAELAESISARGQLQPIAVQSRARGTDFDLVAGWHRLEAMRKVGHDSIPAVILKGLDADAALLAEIDENLIRAELSLAERALHLAERKRLYEKAHPETKHGAIGRGRKKSRQIGDSNERFTKDAAKKTGRSERTIQREIERSKIVDLASVVDTALDEAEELDALAKLPEPVQRNLIERAKAGERVTAKTTALKLKRQERERQLAAATEAAVGKLGKKVYGVLYADPPWKYTNPPMGDVARATENHYPTMTTEAITKLEVPAADDCVLFLWATIPMLPAALAVMAAWGFAYKSAIAWIKDKAGTGYWVRSQCELLLIGTRGDIPAPAPGEQPPAVVDAARARHSEKPAVFAELIERLFPNVPKLEMFARQERPGWDVWGNEIERGYDAADDFGRSLEDCYAAVRARKAAGGEGGARHDGCQHRQPHRR